MRKKRFPRVRRPARCSPTRTDPSLDPVGVQWELRGAVARRDQPLMVFPAWHAFEATEAPSASQDLPFRKLAA